MEKDTKREHDRLCMCVCDWFVARRTNMAAVSWLNAHGTANSKYNEGVEREDSNKGENESGTCGYNYERNKVQCIVFQPLHTLSFQ